MKSRWLMVVTVLCLLLTGLAVAQESWETKARISVPYDFIVAGTTLPAWSYSVQTYSVGNSLKIQNTDKPEYLKVVLANNVVLNPSSMQQDTKFVFLQNGQQHVLHQVCIAGDNHIHDIIHGPDVDELEASMK